MLIQLIQRQVQIGNYVTFSLKNGDDVSGVLIEIGRDHVTLENNEGVATILVDMIGAWKINGDEESSPDTDIQNANYVNRPKPAPVTSTIENKSQNDQSKQIIPENIVKPVFRKIVEIEARFQSHLQIAKLSIKDPDFIFPESEIPKRERTNSTRIWERITNKYKYALKVSELSAKYGRIQPIISATESLVTKSPSSPSLHRHLAYFYFLIGAEQKALESYKFAAKTSRKKDDWNNVAILAIQTGEEILACYSLEQVFTMSSIVEDVDAWYVYVNLLKNNDSLSSLAELLNILERDLLEDELVLLLETAVYLLQIDGKKEDSTKLVARWLEGQLSKSLVQEAYSQLEGQSNESYRQIVNEFSIHIDSERKKQQKKAQQKGRSKQKEGQVYTYLRYKNYGFLRDNSGERYFFHRSAIIDPALYDRLYDLELGKQISVVFEPTMGPKGPLALKVALSRTIDELFEVAMASARDGEYPRAISYIKQVIEQDPEYPESQSMYEKWREYARVTGVPRGSNPYARAKRVQLVEKDLERAIQLFHQAISQRDNVASAVKDLANLYLQQGQPVKAIEFLKKNRKRISDQRSVDNMLQGFYSNAGQYDQVLVLLNEKLKHARGSSEKTQVIWQIANNYLRMEDYTNAKQRFEDVLKLQPDNLAAQRNIAICHFKQQQFDEAEKILNRILDASPDAKAAELLEAITDARTTGESKQVDEIIIDIALSDLSSEISGFSQFFLKRCKFQGVPPERLQAQEFNRFDIKKLEELASQFGTRRPRDRSGYYLSAARIISILEGESSNQFYKYLVRSFASGGDATVAEGRHLDAARELYCEALSVYDRDRSRRKDEQDAVNALVRFLFSTLGLSQIPLTPNIPTIDETVDQVLRRHPQQEKVFDAIAYIVFRSRYAANRILRRLHAGSSLQVMALEYLSNQDISISRPINRLDDFVELWNESRRRRLDEWRSISNEYRFFTRTELTTASLEAVIERLKNVNHRLFLDLDRERSRQIQAIFETTLDLIKQISFEEQERLCVQVDGRCEDLLKEIEGSPTKLSIEDIYPVIETIQDKVKAYLEELYISSMPELELRLPVESYVPDNNQQIEVQIVIANKMGRSPAEALELIVQEDTELFSVDMLEIKLDSSLRGDDQSTLRLPIQVTNQALVSQTFSLPMYAQYRTRSGETEQTRVQNFSVRLYPEEEFQIIDNPYAAYAEGGIVGDPTMFYGRDALIQNITKAIQESQTQSKSIVVFGQKRSGKSSILHHLKTNLDATGNILVIDIGNIGSILDAQSSAPLLYQILWSILRRLEYGIDDMIEKKNLDSLGLSFPTVREFYSHPSPLVFFRDFFDKYKRQAARIEGWKKLRLILLIDEFSYIYGLITSGRVPELFMKNWKALLQENYFSVVLAGQDVMPKFKQHFANEFGTIQDERVSYLRRSDAIRLIDEPIRIGGRQGESRYREKAIDLIMDLTASSPFYIQIICDRLVRDMNERHALLATDADVRRVRDDLVRGVNALSLDKFENLINSGDTSDDAISDEDALKVLREIAMNSKTGPCNRNSIACNTQIPVDTILTDLVNREVVERERERYYRIRVGLFKDWLITHQ